jgi:hypothetical protein
LSSSFAITARTALNAATTGSNTFIGNQIISGSATFRDDIIVNGNIGVGVTPNTTSKLHVDNGIGSSVKFQNTYFSNPLEISSGYARGGIFNNAEYIPVSGVNRWVIRDLGATDSAGILFDNSGRLKFITVPTTGTGSGSRVLTHSELLDNTSMTILSNGYVGILNESPSYALDVSGSGRITSNLLVNGTVTATTFSGTATTASYVLNAISSSFATNATTASYVLNAISSSFAQNARTASYVLNAISSSFATNATTASYVLNAVSSSFAQNATNATTASYILNAVSSSFAITARTALNAATTGSNTFIGNQVISGSATFRDDIIVNGITIGEGGGSSGTNTVVGAGSGIANTTGLYNSFFGGSSGVATTAGTQNTFIGYQSGRLNTSGSYNTFLGVNSGYSGTTGNFNTFIGNNSGIANTTGNNNVLIGYDAGSDLTTGANNTIIGNITGSAGLANTVIIGAGATERFRIDSSGYMGLGTIDPTAPFDVLRSTGAADSNGGGINLSRFNSGSVFRGGSIYSRYIGTAGQDALVFGVTTTDNKNPYSDFDQARMVILSNGNVGIGTTSPSQSLHIFTGTPYQIQVQRSGVGSALIGVSAQTIGSIGDLLFEGTQASQGFVFRSRNASNALVNSLGIDRNGNVGIGTFNPSYKLDITGTVHSTGNVIIDSNLGIGTNSPTYKLDIVDPRGIVLRHSETTNTSGAFRIMGGSYTGNDMTGLMFNAISGTNQLNYGGGTGLAEPATIHRFNVGAYGTKGTGTEVMNISSNGITVTGTGSFTHVDTGQGATDVYLMNQNLRTTDSVTFANITGSLSGNASTATTLQTARTINGTSFNGSANIVIPNLVSGSSQIVYGSISSIPAGIVSGSSQINADTITNFDTNVLAYNNSLGVVSGSRTVTIGSTGITLGGTATTIAGLTSVSSTGFTGSLSGNASTATTASFAVTASYVLNGSSSSISSFVHTQSTPATTWTVNHNLNRQYPVITVYDSNGYVMIPETIRSVTVNQITVTFPINETGVVSCI